MLVLQPMLDCLVPPKPKTGTTFTTSHLPPRSSLPVLPLKSASACCGRNVPLKGAEPALIGVAAESSKMVRAPVHMLRRDTSA